ncbi:MAG: type II toxin-antitoxin system RelE/ParE family toxin [Planctomycetota bacterium]
MTHKVRIEEAAHADIQEILSFIERRDGTKRADKIEDKLYDLIESLSSMPDRGHRVREIQGYGITGFLEVVSRPYRIIYLIEKKTVYILLVVDGRRDFQSILLDRILMQ